MSYASVLAELGAARATAARGTTDTAAVPEDFPAAGAESAPKRARPGPCVDNGITPPGRQLPALGGAVAPLVMDEPEEEGLVVDDCGLSVAAALQTAVRRDVGAAAVRNPGEAPAA